MGIEELLCLAFQLQWWDRHCQFDSSEENGRNVGSISFIVNGMIMIIAGVTFGWKYAPYSMITIFVSEIG